MKRKDALADRLIAGTSDAALRLAWWPRHSAMVGLYIDSMDQAQPFKGRDVMFHAAKYWDALVLDASGLMSEHTALEIALVDAVAVKDTSAVDRVSELLSANIQQQQAMYVARIPEFPAGRFSELIREHARLFFETLASKTAGDVRKRLLCDAKRGHNAVSLGAFMTEWVTGN